MLCTNTCFAPVWKEVDDKNYGKSIAIDSKKKQSYHFIVFVCVLYILFMYLMDLISRVWNFFVDNFHFKSANQSLVISKSVMQLHN